MDDKYPPPSNYSEASGSINYVANDNYSLSNKKVYPFLSSIFEVDGVKYVPVSPSERTCDAIDCTYDESVTDITIDSMVSFKGIAMNVKEVMPYTLYKKGAVKSVKVVNDGSIGDKAFYDCDSLTTVSIANNGNIGSSAFYDCDNISKAIINNNGNIGTSAFEGCSNDTKAEVIITNKGDIGNRAFYDCDNISVLSVANDGNIT